MVIHYIWIDKYANLKEQGVNLSEKYIFEIDISKLIKNKRKGILKIKLNPDYIPNFFEKENVKNITAIIGKNGSGKSNILNYIKSNFPGGLNAKVASSIVAYTYSEANGSEIGCVAFPGSWNIEIHDDTNSFNIIKYYNDLVNPAFGYATKIGDADYIYYSFFLDYKDGGMNWKGLTDISTTSLLLKERKSKIEKQRNSNKLDSSLMYSSDLFFLEGIEIEKSIQFLNSKFKNLIPFKAPKELFMTIDRDDERFIEQNEETYRDTILLLNSLKERSKNKYDYNEAYNDLYIAIFANFIVTHRSYSVGNEKIPLSVNIEEKESPKDFLIRFFKELKNIKTEYKGDSIPVQKFEDLSKYVPLFIEIINALVLENFIEIRKTTNTNSYTYVFKLKEKSDENFSQFYDLYTSIKGLTKFLDFRWRGLSTGEQSFLSFMSRFYSAKIYSEGNNFEKDLVVLIDEGDAGFHPEWQRQFFSKSLDFLSELFKGHSLQLIYTANAPFITSDLTKSHVLFIEKTSTTESTVKIKNNDRKETFGANIHALFSDAFYMDEVLIGEFAKRKINKIIDYLKNPKKTELDESIKKTISLIGEPIIKTKLLEMWYEKFGDNEKIDWHKKQIIELEKKKDGKSWKNSDRTQD